MGGLNKGAVLQGKYTFLFDSNGKLKSTNEFTIENNSSLYTSFLKSMLMAESVVPTIPVEEPRGRKPTNASKFKIVMI